MQLVLDGLSSLGRAMVDPLWRPLLAWTVLALPFWALLERTDRLHPNAEYRLAQVLLAALPIGIAAVSVVERLPDATRSAMLPAQSVVVLPVIETTTVSASAPSWTWMHAVGLLTVGALGIGLFQLGRLALQIVAVGRVRRRLEATMNPSLEAELNRLRERLGVRRPVQVCSTSGAAVPMTLGGLHPTILVPERLTEATTDLRMTLRHELVHVRRWDDCAHLAERFVAALFAAHPLVGRLRRQIAGARERACDAAVLDDGETSAGDYARLLAAFADESSPPRLGALSLSESPSPLIDRLTAMRSSMPSLLTSRTALSTALVVVGLGLTLGVVACADSVEPSPSAEASTATKSSSSAPADDSEVYMVVDDQPELVGGMKALQRSVSYPQMARQAGIEGRVIVQFVVDKEGDVTAPKITRGVHDVLNEAALKAVKQQDFRPGQQDGEPVKVQMSLPVTFRLPNASGGAAKGSGGDATASSPSSKTEAAEARLKALDLQMAYIKPAE
jgi:TonB family protein